MSFCCVFGFFRIDFVLHLEFVRAEPLKIPACPWTVRSVSLFPIYKFGMANSASLITGASMRGRSSFPGEVIERGAFVFIVGVLCVRAGQEDSLIDACQMQLFPAVPSHSGLPACRTFATFPASYVSASGVVVSSPPYRLSDYKIVVPVWVSQYVRRSLETFDVACVHSFSPGFFPLILPSTAAYYHQLNSSLKKTHLLALEAICTSADRALAFSLPVSWLSMQKTLVSTVCVFYLLCNYASLNMCPNYYSTAYALAQPQTLF